MFARLPLFDQLMMGFQTTVLERGQPESTHAVSTSTTITAYPEARPAVPTTDLDLILLEDTIWLLVGDVNVPHSDVAIADLLARYRPRRQTEKITAIARGGTIANYHQLYQDLAANGVQLVHSPEQYRLASELPQWYPLLAGLTPKSLWFNTPPTFTELAQKLGVPFVVQSSRQTRNSQAAVLIIHNRAEYETAIALHKTDPALQQQALICREFVPLRAVPAEPSEQIAPSFEFRSFWWRGRCIGAGQCGLTTDDWADEEQAGALAIAQKAATRLDLPFVAIDVAQTAAGEWLVVQCNDAQECDYGAVSPFTLWQNLVFEEQQIYRI